MAKPKTGRKTGAASQPRTDDAPLKGAIEHLANCLDRILDALPGGGAGALASAREEVEHARSALAGRSRGR